jgi:DNA-binding response OmpR family regulator
MSTESPLSGKTILAVDDEPDVLATLAELLEMSLVVTKTNYDDAVVYLKHNNPDLAILDIMGVNGFELLKLCVEKKIDAVMLTAHAFSIESLKKSLELGARAYLPKEKMADIVSFLEDVVTKEHNENWQRLFDRLGELLNATFGSNWNKELIEIGPFVVPE